MNQVNKLIVLAILLQGCFADIYIHNPRGSNNRLNERGRGRNNANRMFDSQNNNRGGYNVGNLFYYAGSKLRIEWTNQHSCGNQNANCDIIIQYMCGSLVRDGTVTTTIPTNPTQCNNLNCNTDYTFGMHEDFYSYIHCRSRLRDTRLFTADRNIRINQATRTRQNSNGNRRGYECPEEKDYYPYWHPTQWKDIAVLTNDVSRCPMYTTESHNVKDRWYCDVSSSYLYMRSTSNSGNNLIPITKEACETFTYTVGNVQYNATWRRSPAHGIAAPSCGRNMWSRDNHLGNTVGGQTFNYNWTIPNDVNEKCVLRMRYNISTGDYDRDNTTSAHNHRRRREVGPDVWTRQGLTQPEGDVRGYEFKADPIVDIFGLNKLKLRLALATQQYGRTFQDRSHTFAIRPRPPTIPTDAVIENLNVRGKRGNIVQVYPGVEYDFVPNTLQLTSGSYVHMQWTGSDSNPNNNDGQGRQGTDRSNMVMLKSPVYTEGNPSSKVGVWGQLGSTMAEHLNTASIGGLPIEDLKSLATLSSKQFGGDMDELDDAGTYFDLGPRKITSTGTYHYMCTRNNNFSNRSQKGKLIVSDSLLASDTIDSQGGAITMTGSSSPTSVVVPPGALTAPVYMEVWELKSTEYTIKTNPSHSDLISDVMHLTPNGQLTPNGMQMKVSMKVNENVGPLYDVTVYRSTDGTSTWVQLESSKSGTGMVSFQTASGGHFVAAKSVAAGPMAGLVLGLIIGVILIILIAVLIRKNRLTLSGYGGKI